MNKVLLTILPFLLAACLVEGQTVILQGTVTDDLQELLVGATLKVSQHGKFISGTVTNMEGHFRCSLRPGIYDLEFLYSCGLNVQRMEDFEVLSDSINVFNAVIPGPAVNRKPFVYYCPIPMIRSDETSSGQTFTAAQLRHMY